jgi:hypothetical protein
MTQNRKKQSAVLMLAMLFTLLTGAGVWACSNMGPDKHVGLVKAIDMKEGVLTLIDAETGKPLQFATAASLLKEVKVNDKAVVTFKSEGERLVAKELLVR